MQLLTTTDSGIAKYDARNEMSKTTSLAAFIQAPHNRYRNPKGDDYVQAGGKVELQESIAKGTARARVARTHTHTPEREREGSLYHDSR